MNTRITTSPVTTPDLSRPSPVEFQPVRAHLWRVVDRRGRIIGHLQEVTRGSSTRWLARRLHPAHRTFRDLGEFWSPDDAVDCVRFS